MKHSHTLSSQSGQSVRACARPGRVLLRSVFSLLACLLLGAQARAEIFESGLLRYYITSPTTVSFCGVVQENGVVVINGYRYSLENCTLSLPDQVEHNGVTYDITSVASFPFTHSTGGLNNYPPTILRLPARLDTIGVGAFSQCKFRGELELPSTLRVIGESAFEKAHIQGELRLPASLRVIGISAFQGCDSITAVNLPEGLQQIGDAAFKECRALESVRYASSDLHYGPHREGFIYGVFGYCKPLAVYVDASVRSVPGYIFSNKIRSLEFAPQSQLEEICGWAFVQDVDTLSSGYTLHLPESLRIIGERAFYRAPITELTIPAGVDSIGKAAFVGGYRLEKVYYGPANARINAKETLIEGGSKAKSGGLSITIGREVRHLPARLFYGNTRISGLTFEQGGQLETIGSEAFSSRYSSKLDTITPGFAVRLPESLRLIEGSAFAGLLITDLTIPAGVDSIGKSAFERCYRLENVYYGPADVRLPSVGRRGGSPPIFSQAGEYAPSGLHVTIGKQVRRIPDYLFADLNNTTSLTFEAGSQLQVIGKSAFRYQRSSQDEYKAVCSPLTGELRLPEGVQSVGELAFACTGITSLYVPAGLQEMGAIAFNECYFLGSVDFNAREMAISQGYYSGQPFGGAGKAVGGYALRIGPEVKVIAKSLFAGLAGYEGEEELSSSDFKRYGYGVRTLTWSDPCVVDSIGESAFEGHPFSQRELVVPASVRVVGQYAFSGCGVKELVVGPGVETIGRSAFSVGVLDKLTYRALKLADCRKSGSSYVFQMCSDTVRQFCVGREVKRLPAGLMYGVPIDTLVFESGSLLEEVGEQAFARTESSRSFYGVSLAGLEHLRRIGALAFQGNRMRALSLNDQMEIGRSAFSPGSGHCLSRLDLNLSTTAPGDSLNRWGVLLDGELHVGPCVTVLDKGFLAYPYHKLRSLTFGAKCKLDSIADGALCKDSSFLQGPLVLPPTVRYIGGSNFYKAGITGPLVLPEALEFVGSSAFKGCKGLTGDLVLPSRVQRVEGSAFEGCQGLTGELFVPAATRFIGCDAFAATGLTRLTLEDGDSTLSFGDNFRATGGWIIKAPRRGPARDPVSMSGTIIETGQFAKMPLRTAYIGRTLSYRCGSVMQMSWGGHYYSPFSGCRTLRAVQVGECVTSLLPYQLAECVALEGVVLPPTMRAIYEGAFQGDSALTHIVLPDSLEGVDVCGFADCAALERVSVGPGTRLLGKSAFWGCKNLQQVVCAREDVPYAYESTFQYVDVQNCQLLVPPGAKQSYAAAQVWKDFMISEQDLTPVHGVELDPGSERYADTGHAPGTSAQPAVLTPAQASLLAGEWYSLAGARLRQPARGVNLLRTPGGEVRKVLVR